MCRTGEGALRPAAVEIVFPDLWNFFLPPFVDGKREVMEGKQKKNQGENSFNRNIKCDTLINNR